MGREAKLSEAKRELREAEMNEWFRTERSLIVFKPGGTEDVFHPLDIGHVRDRLARLVGPISTAIRSWCRRS
jgi:hypothetical protein